MVKQSNLTLENYLRSFVDSSLDNWDELLPVAQLAINNSYQSTIKSTPFWLNYGRHPWLPGVTYTQAGMGKDGQSSPEIAEQRQRKRISERLGWDKERRAAVHRARECLKQARARMKEQFDKHRLPKEFAPGDRVLVSTENLKFKGHNAKKLLPRFVGPFTVIEKVGSVSYKLALPDTMRVHPVFNVEMLRPYKGSDFTPPPAVVCEDGTVLWEVERIIDVRGSGASRRYLVRWQGFGPEHDTWEPRRVLLVDCPLAVQEFEEKQQRQPARLAPVRHRVRWWDETN